MKRKHALQLLKWRRACPCACRTGPTKRQHLRWVKEHKDHMVFRVGMGGRLSWWGAIVNGELSIVVNPRFRNMGIGKFIVKLLIDHGRLWGYSKLGVECYKCNPSIGFWYGMAEIYDCEVEHLENRKQYKGKWYGSIYYEIPVVVAPVTDVGPSPRDNLHPGPDS